MRALMKKLLFWRAKRPTTLSASRMKANWAARLRLAPFNIKMQPGSRRRSGHPPSLLLWLSLPTRYNNVASLVCTSRAGTAAAAACSSRPYSSTTTTTYYYYIAREGVILGWRATGSFISGPVYDTACLLAAYTDCCPPSFCVCSSISLSFIYLFFCVCRFLSSASGTQHLVVCSLFVLHQHKTVDESPRKMKDSQPIVI